MRSDVIAHCAPVNHTSLPEPAPKPPREVTNLPVELWAMIYDALPPDQFPIAMQINRNAFAARPTERHLRQRLACTQPAIHAQPDTYASLSRALSWRANFQEGLYHRPIAAHIAHVARISAYQASDIAHLLSGQHTIRFGLARNDSYLATPTSRSAVTLYTRHGSTFWPTLRLATRFEAGQSSFDPTSRFVMVSSRQNPMAHRLPRGDAQLWALQPTGATLVRTLRLFPGLRVGIAWSPDGRFGALVQDKPHTQSTTRIFDTQADGRLYLTYASPRARLGFPQVTHDSTLAATVNAHGALVLFDLTGQRPKAYPVAQVPSRTELFELSSDGKILAAIHYPQPAGLPMLSVLAIDAQTATTPIYTEQGIAQGVRGLALAPNGRTLLYQVGGPSRLLHTADGAVSWTRDLGLRTRHTRRSLFSPDSQHVCLEMRSAHHVHLFVHAVGTSLPLMHLYTGPTYPQHFSFAATGRNLLVQRDSAQLQFWDLHAMHSLDTWNPNYRGRMVSVQDLHMQSAHFTADGQHVFVSGLRRHANLRHWQWELHMVGPEVKSQPYDRIPRPWPL